MRWAGAVAVLAGLHAGVPAAQEVRTAVVPDTIMAGDIFRVAIQVRVPRGSSVAFPDSLDVPADVELAGSRVIERDSVDGAVDVVRATYRLTAWRPGSLAFAPASVSARIGPDVVDLVVRLPAVTVLSVLPPDTAGIEPRPPRGVLGPDRTLLPLLALLALAAAVAGAIYWAVRRRRRPIAGVALRPAREVALEALDRIRSSGLLESGQYRAFCAAVSEVVRTYLAAIDPALGTELTTSELAGALRTEARQPPARIDEAAAVLLTRTAVSRDPAAGVIDLLGAADLLKFTGLAGSANGADTLWSTARDWVGEHDAGFRRAA